MKTTINELYFYGRPFPASLIDQNRSFAEQNMMMENDEEFTSFLKENNLENNRASLVVFNPDSFMYWYGAISEHELTKNHGMLKMNLPKSEVAIKETNGDLANLSTPLNSSIPSFLKEVTAEGIKVYENLGDSPLPYVLQKVDLDTKKLPQVLYLKVSE